MLYFVGAGPGAVDLITMRGHKLLCESDVVIYAGSLVNPELLKYTKVCCEIHNSAQMTLEEVIEVVKKAESQNEMTVRLHTGDSSIYGAIREQIDILKSLMQGDTKSIPKIVLNYALAYAALLLFPWLLDLIKGIFA